MSRDLFLADGILSPLRIAGLAAWIAAWFSFEAAAGDSSIVLVRAVSLAFLALYLLQDRIASRLGDNAWLLYCAACTTLALAVIGLAPRTAAPILLVQSAPPWARRHGAGTVSLALLGSSAALAVIMWLKWPHGTHFWIQWTAFASLQAFAVLVSFYAVQSQARAARLRLLNSELVATRSLLAHGARDGERLRISRELHDIIGHKLTALKLHLAVARDEPEGASRNLQLPLRLVDDLLAELRAVVRQMRQGDGLEISAALQELGAAFPGPRLQVQADPDLRVMRIQIAEILLRATQEALTNAARHANATVLRVELRRNDGNIHVVFRDDGRVRGELREGMGLKGMRERFEEAGGSLVLAIDQQGSLCLTGTVPEAQ